MQEISIQQEDENDKWSTRVIRRPKSEPNFFPTRSQPGKLKKEESLYVCDIDENEWRNSKFSKYLINSYSLSKKWMKKLTKSCTKRKKRKIILKDFKSFIKKKS